MPARASVFRAGRDFAVMIKIIEKNFGREYRAAVISDIHGSFGLLKRLLNREEVRGADRLVFDGDYISRGRESLACMRFLMSLEGRENVTVLKGNLERLINWYLHGDSEAILRHFTVHRRNLFRECAEEQGFMQVTESNFEKLRKVFREKYADIIEYAAYLPNALETEDFVFTHAGLGAVPNWRDSTEQDVMKNDPFIKTGVNTTGKWLVCGHMPTWNSPLSENTNNCIVDKTRKCVFIDGGNQVKSFAQLNALIAEKREEMSFATVFESFYPVFYAAEDFVPEDDFGCEKDCWPQKALSVVERGEDFSLCEREDGARIYVNNAHLRFDAAGASFACNSVSSLLSVKKGERLELLDAAEGRFVFVRSGAGRIGWVGREVLG